MASSKELKISATLDAGSFQAANRALAEMTKKAQELAKALQGIGMPGGGAGILSGGSVTGGGSGGNRGGSVPMGSNQAINANLNIFKNMATLGTASLKGLTDALKTSTQQQQTQLNNLKRSLDALGDTYDRLGGKGKNAAAVQAKMLQVAGMVQGAQANLAALQAAGPVSNLLPDVGPPGGPRILPGARSGLPGMPTGFAGAAWQFRNGNIGAGLTTPIGPGAVSPQGLLQGLMGSGAGALALRAAGLVVSGAVLAANTSQSFNNLMLDTTSSRGRAMGGAWQRMRQVDTSDALAERHIEAMGDSDKQGIMRSVFSPEEIAKGWASGTWTAAKAFGGEVSVLTPEEQETQRAAKYQAMLGKVRERGEYITQEGRTSEYLAQTRGDRLVAQRILGVGFNRDEKGNWSNYGQYEADLHRSGYSVGEEASAKMALRGLGGDRFADTYRRTVMGATGAGYDIAPILAAAGRGSNDKAALGLTQAALGGGISTAAGLQLGQSLFGFDPRGTVSGVGALQTIQQGFQFTGGIGDMNQVARAQLGMQSLDRTTQGFDPYQKGMNLVSAIRAMPGASTYAQDALAKMGFKELAEIYRGGSTITSRAWDIHSSQARAQMQGSLHGVFSTYAEQGGNSPAERAMRAMRASGQDELGYLNKLGLAAQSKDKRGKATQSALSAQAELEAIASVYTRRTGDSAEAGLGAISAASGFELGKGLKHGKLPWGGMDTEEKARREAEAKVKEAEGKTALANLDKVISALDKNAARMDVIGNFMTKLSDQADETTLSLMRLAGASDDAVETMRGEMKKSTTGVALHPAIKAIGGLAGHNPQSKPQAKAGPKTDVLPNIYISPF
jgi:hypothetical protein